MKCGPLPADIETQKVRHQPVVVGEDEELHHHLTIFSARTWVLSSVTRDSADDHVSSLVRGRSYLDYGKEVSTVVGELQGALLQVPGHSCP